MKYLDILKEYDKAIVSESKRLDSIYKKLLGESCNCGKKDCPECNGELKENDKGKMEFDEGEKEGGKQDKKMMPPEDFKQMVSKEEFFGKKDDRGCEGEECNECDPLKGGLHNGHVSEGEEPKKEEPPTEEPKKEEPPAEEPKKKEPPTEEPPAEGAGDENVEEAQNIEKEIKEFFGVTGDGVTGDGESGGENLEEDATENAKMSASDIFAEADEGGEEKEKKEEPPTEEPKEEEPKKEEPPAEEPKKEEPKKEDGESVDDGGEVNENSGKGIRELMGKSEGVSEGEKLSMKEIMAKESCCNEDDPLRGGLHNGHQVEEEVDDETKNLNESIQAIRQFVKANKKYFK